MTQLTGISKRLVVEKIEVVSDNGEFVLVVERGKSEKATLTVRKPWESTWNASGPVFTLDDSEGVTVVAQTIQGYDQQYGFERIGRIQTQSYSKADPTPKVDENCAPLDIERAKAANLAEARENLRLQLAIDHRNDKHNPRIEGCVDCDNAIYPGHGDGSLPTMDDAELPF